MNRREWKEQIRKRGPGPTTTLVLYALSEFMNADGSRCRPSGERLAKETRLSLRAVRQHVGIAENEGWIRVESAALNGRQWKQNLYVPTAPDVVHEVHHVEGEEVVHDMHHDGAGRSANDDRDVVHEVHTTQTVTQTNTIGASRCTYPPLGRLKKDSGGRHVYPESFNSVMAIYPARRGSNPKAKAYSAWRARIVAGAGEDEMHAGVVRYAPYIRATDRWDTEFVMQAATFFGPDEHWAEPWTLPAAEPTRPEEPSYAETAGQEWRDGTAGRGANV